METRARDLSADAERAQQRLRDLAQSVLNGEDDFYGGDDGGRISPRRLSPVRGGDRYDSPERNLSR